jgi:hypothetical protein
MKDMDMEHFFKSLRLKHILDFGKMEEFLQKTKKI